MAKVRHRRPGERIGPRLAESVIAFGLGARRYASGPVRFSGSAGTTANCLVLVGLAVNPYTAGGAALYYGATLLVAARRGQPGCERRCSRIRSSAATTRSAAQSSRRLTRPRHGSTHEGRPADASHDRPSPRRRTRSLDQAGWQLRDGGPRHDSLAHAYVGGERLESLLLRDRDPRAPEPTGVAGCPLPRFH
jgi:hypothetical protein